MIFQTFNLLPTLTGVENVALPLRLQGLRGPQSWAKARTMLERVGLSERFEHRPDEMSGGERQRVALARAFLKDAPLLILDEPTSSVDVKTEAAILEAMARLMRGRTSFLITHRTSTLVGCDVQLQLEGGRLVQPPRSLVGQAS